MGLLIESRVDPLTERRRPDAALNNRRRVSSQLAALDGLFAFSRRAARPDRGGHRRGPAAPASRTAARSISAARTTTRPTPPRTIQDPPCGYRLDAAQYAEVEDELALHGVGSRPDGAVPSYRCASRCASSSRCCSTARAAYHLDVG